MATGGMRDVSRERNVVRGNESRPIAVAGRIDPPTSASLFQESGWKKKGIEKKKKRFGGG